MKFCKNRLLGLFAILLVSSNFAAASRRVEMRSTLLGVLDELSFHEDADLQAQLTPLVHSYRASNNLSASTLTISDAPFLGFVLQAKVSELFPAAYDSQYAEQYDKVVVHPTLEFIFDKFIGGYLEGTLPPELAQSASKLGSCLAYKTQRGKSPGCPLDESDNVYQPGTIKLALVKLACHLPVPNACATRRLIFNSAKPDLLKARKDQALAGPFKEQFPKEFHDGFLKDLAEKRKTLPGLVNTKFKGDLSSLWDAKTALVEVDDESAPSKVALKGFAQGLRADLGVAARFAHSKDAKERGLAAALFYASANRILLLTGNTRAAWNDKTGKDGAFLLNPSDSFDPAQPKRPPVFVGESFGGWSMGRAPTGAFDFQFWDWSAYDPARQLRLFPSELMLGTNGVPMVDPASHPVEKLDDLAELIAGLAEFLRATRSDGPLGDHFGGVQDIAKLLDPASPMIFPTDGRALAFGALAGVLKNLITANVGHLEQTQPGLPQSGLGLIFHDGVRLGDRDAPGAPVRSVARLLSAAAELRFAIHGDADVPADLLAQAPQLDTALQVGALTLSAQGQNPDGGFAESLTLPQAPATAQPGRQLLTSVEGLRALAHAYDASRILAIRLNLKAGWEYLDRYWIAENPLPRLVEGGLPPTASSSDLWMVLQLWNETQQVVRPDLAADLDWAKWERRVAALRAQLVGELRAPPKAEPFLE